MFRNDLISGISQEKLLNGAPCAAHTLPCNRGECGLGLPSPPLSVRPWLPNATTPLLLRPSLSLSAAPPSLAKDGCGGGGERVHAAFANSRHDVAVGPYVIRYCTTKAMFPCGAIYSAPYLITTSVLNQRFLFTFSTWFIDLSWDRK